MATPRPVDMQVPIDKEFFCDGHYYVLTSSSLGGSGLSAEEVADVLGEGAPDRMNDLLQRGVCLPLFYDGDCAMDGDTVFIVGALDSEHERAWIGRLRSRLEIPCGRLVLLAGGGDPDGLARALSGKPPDPDYVVHQTIEVPPGTYDVDIMAYANSMTVAVHEEDLDEQEIAERYAHLPQVRESYVVHLRPASGEVRMPVLVSHVGWPGVFEFREPR
jgi:hypothetical protein